MWCPECYRCEDTVGFVVRNEEDEDGGVVAGIGEDTDYLIGRAGDPIVTPFQCEQCHFRNIYGRDPSWGEQDRKACMFIRHANLDGFWDWSSATVGAQVRETKRLIRISEEFGFPTPLPPMGPWPLEDVQGMMTAMVMLRRSLDPGRNERLVQFDTVRKTRSVVTNLHQASAGGLQDRIGAYERSKIWISSVSTHSFWFTRFMGGNHKRVGQLKMQDEPILIDTMKGLQQMWEDLWWETAEIETRRTIVMQACWFLVGFCCGLRGEEMLLILKEATLNSFREDDGRIKAHFEVVLSGATKGNRCRGAKFRIPCLCVTGKSRLKPGRWLQCLGELEEENPGQRLFGSDGTDTRLSMFHEVFYGALEEGKARGIDGIKQGEIREVYGILRSIRRGTTAHAKNMGVATKLLNAVNRWRRHKDSKTNAPRLDMDKVYSQLDAIKPMILRFTEAL